MDTEHTTQVNTPDTQQPVAHTRPCTSTQGSRYIEKQVELNKDQTKSNPGLILANQVFLSVQI